MKAIVLLVLMFTAATAFAGRGGGFGGSRSGFSSGRSSSFGGFRSSPGATYSRPTPSYRPPSSSGSWFGGLRSRPSATITRPSPSPSYTEHHYHSTGPSFFEQMFWYNMFFGQRQQPAPQTVVVTPSATAQAAPGQVTQQPMVITTAQPEEESHPIWTFFKWVMILSIIGAAGYFFWKIYTEAT